MKNKLFRFYVLIKGEYGEPFALCKKHSKTYIPPQTVIMEKLGKTNERCNECGK